MTKQCRICEQHLPLDAFGSHRGHRDGLQNYCRPCRNRTARDMLTPEQKARKKANSKRFALVQDRKIKRRGYRYNLSPEEFNELLQEQQGLCAICLKSETYEHRTLCVDHEHQSGIVRGLLCSRCNKALGGFFDSPELLRAAIKYVERAKRDEQDPAQEVTDKLVEQTDLSRQE